MRPTLHFLFIKVYDHDQGRNGTFSLYLEGDEGIFEVTPTSGINEASFILRVVGSVDYELARVYNLSLVARELAAPHRQSSIPVTVFIRWVKPAIYNILSIQEVLTNFVQ